MNVFQGEPLIVYRPVLLISLQTEYLHPLLLVDRKRIKVDDDLDLVFACASDGITLIILSDVRS